LAPIKRGTGKAISEICFLAAIGESGNFPPSLRESREAAKNNREVKNGN
jgi:hypothetical protein